ncbi:hypothetical protein [Polynucleobacter asymbioticus]|jgi:hypothetical protein|uniref:Uncharacterized protein n=1 Tax=Polynucleobacter asymbioticus TaxID=576611 RepID=A0AAC9ISP3_9BURK|nr:hypothetical protein [Polynucleobacter asymbioticus]APB99066.1 hypothetical protein A4F89_06845 [Polynucleobacter asymbioticus]APC01366.1 hypothetical protein AOC25_06930 [Polynucleobacter asymbioticus]
MKRDLPKRVYKFRNLYRYIPKGEKAINLGHNKDEALAKFYSIQNQKNINKDEIVSLEKTVMIMWKRHLKGSKQRKIEFQITVEDIEMALKQQKFKCAITKIRFNESKPDGMRFRPWLPSIDRVDNSKGYTKDNIRILCAFVNIAMNGFGEGFFKYVLEPLVEEQVKARLEVIKLTNNP